MRKTIIGIMGGGEGSEEKELRQAYELGALIAKEGFVALTGGRNAGIMEAALKGAKDNDGLTVGILTGKDSSETSKYVDIEILTGMGSARNVINILSSTVVVVCKGKAGTISELALALKSKRKTILLDFDVGKIFNEYEKEGLLFRAKTPAEAMKTIKSLVAK